ncbi:hypothetical protein [Kutzneria sp. NPDC051319]|uniref:hypothetical protein n=1 Tax=Kutzneria sp. NPDC051319 TaxID=3155047 RepID=UPI003415C4D1
MGVQGAGNRPPWYVFVLAVLGVLLVLTAVIGFGPRSSGGPLPTAEPVPQPYRGTDTPTPTSLLGDPTSVTVATTSSSRAVVTVTTAAPIITPTTTAPSTTTRRTTTIALTGPANPPYCCWYGGGDWGGHHHR